MEFARAWWMKERNLRTSRYAARTTGPVTTFPRPEEAEPAPVPGEHRDRLHRHERWPPVAPRLRQPRPEHAVRPGQTHPRAARSIYHLSLPETTAACDGRSITCDRQRPLVGSLEPRARRPGDR